jgi:5-methylcytosine-specific restriction endonuclease McrA
VQISISVSGKVIEETKTEVNINFSDFKYKRQNRTSVAMNKITGKMKSLSITDKKQPKLPKRKPLPKQVSDMVWIKWQSKEKTSGICYCCGLEITLLPKNYECGHVKSKYNGGSDQISNLRPICKSCNLSMGIQNMNDYMVQYGYDKTNFECFNTLTEE